MFTDCFDISKIIILLCSVVAYLAIFIEVTAYVLNIKLRVGKLLPIHKLHLLTFTV
jgi:hypothetical protein